MNVRVEVIDQAWLDDEGRTVLPLRLNGVRYDWSVPPECDTPAKAKEFLRLKIERAESGPLAEAKTAQRPAPRNPLGAIGLVLEV